MPRKRRSGTPLLEEQSMEMTIFGARIGEPTGDGFTPVAVETSRGEVECRYYAVAGGSQQAAVFVGGAGGGFDTPVRGFLYPRLCEQLPNDGIACLQLRYRHPGVLEECTLDVLAGLYFLESEGIQAVALVGHSFGGAVVIQAAAHSPRVRTILPLSTQSHGAEPAATLGERCSIFLYHGEADEVLPPACSEYVYRVANNCRKKMTIRPGTRHGLDEAADELPDEMRRWIKSELDKALAQSVV